MGGWEGTVLAQVETSFLVGGLNMWGFFLVGERIFGDDFTWLGNGRVGVLKLLSTENFIGPKPIRYT